MIEIHSSRHKVGLFIILCLIIGFVVISFGGYYVKAITPAYKSVIKALFSEYELVSLEVDTNGHESKFLLNVINSNVRYINGRRLEKGVAFTAKTLTGHSILHILILLPVVMTLLIYSKEGRAKLLFTASVFIVTIEIIDVPFVLIGSIEALINKTLLYNSVTNNMISWIQFLNGGGRQAILVAMSAILVIQQEPFKKTALAIKR